MRIVSLVVVAGMSLATGRSQGKPPPAPSGPVEVPADRGADVVLPDGVAVTLEPGTRGRWLPRTKLPSETNRYTQGYHLVLTEGEIEVRMPPGARGSHAFLVATPDGTLTDWRGKLHVRVHGGTTAAAIYEGALVVGSNGVGFPVYDGAGIVLRKGVDPDKSKSIPPAPAWETDRASPSFAVVPAGASGQVRFAWKPVPGAASYRTIVATDPGMTHVLEVATTSETSFAMVEREPAGRYFVQVRAVGSEGIVGEWSTPRPLRVVHYAIPDGAVVARDGAVVLRPREGVTLTGADGIEVSYTTPGPGGDAAPLYWAKLSGPIALPYDDGVTDRVAHLRDPAVAGEATIRLARRQLRADIELFPKDARAGDPVDVRALVWDPSGRLDGANQPVTFQALLDIDPIPVAWQRTGNAWTAHIRARPPTGPTVIRVTATDDRGTEIGRGFLELAGAPVSRR